MKKEKLEWKRMVEGKLYNATSKDIFWQHARGLWLTQKLNKCSVLNQPRQKRLFNKLIPSSKGKSVWAFTPFYCEYGVNINVGNGVFFNYGCTLLDISPITLEDGVWLGANVTIATPCHPLLAHERINTQYPDGFHDLEYSKPVTIKKERLDCVERHDLRRSHDRRKHGCGRRQRRNARLAGKLHCGRLACKSSTLS